MKVVTDDEIVLKNLRLNLKKKVDPEPPQKNYFDRKPDQKAIKDMNELVKGIEDTIVDMKKSMHEKLKKTKDDLTRQLDKNKKKHFDQLKAESLKKSQTEEQSIKNAMGLKERYETMCKMAEKIDEDNRVLVQHNQQLNIDFKCQADKDLILQQIIYFKKEHTRLEQEAKELRLKVEAAKKTEDQQFKQIPDLRKARGRENDSAVRNSVQTKGPRPFTATYKVKS